MRAKTIVILAVVIFLLGGAIGALYAVLSANTPSANEDLPVSSYDEFQNNDDENKNEDENGEQNQNIDENTDEQNQSGVENNNVTNEENNNQTTNEENNQTTEHKVGEVNVKEDSALSLRKGPGTNYERLGQVYRGDQLDILEEQNGWYKVQTYDGVEAWVSADYVTIIE